MIYLLIYILLIIINFITIAVIIKKINKRKLTLNELTIIFFASISMLAPIVLISFLLVKYGETEIW